MQFPWSAVVGQDALKHALMLCAIDPAVGGVLVHGPRGVAKTTLARALGELVPGQFVELPLGATEERVTGTLNLELALQDGRVEFAPGLLARAHDGVLYVDEVNLLPDALVDVLLDAAATGRNVVERDGVSHTHPARFVLIGSMNPEEGELRPQLIDRFGLSASAQGLIPPAERAEIVTRRLEFDRDPERFRAEYAAQQAALVERCRRARTRAGMIALAGPALTRVTERCHAAGVEGVRADLAMLRAARAHAAWNDRTEITIDDVDAVAELALAHRVPRGPDGEPGGGQGGAAAGGGGRGSGRGGGGTSFAGPSSLQRGDSESSAHGGRSGGRNADDGGESLTADGVRDEETSGAFSDGVFRDGPVNDRGGAGDSARGRGALPARPVRAAMIPELPSWMRAAHGRRPGKYRRGAAQLSAAVGARGRTNANLGAIDWFATLSEYRRACSRGESANVAAESMRGVATACTRLRPRRDQLRYRERRTPAAQLWIVAVDCSSSMLRSGGLAVAKGVAHALEQSARRAGARLAVISFRGAGARLEVDSSPGRAVLPRAIAALGGGGGTPLHEALSAAQQLCKQTRWRTPGVFKRLLILTDGRVRSSPASAATLPTDLHRIVIDCERGRLRLDRSQQLAAALRADYWRPNV
jgi:Mg-chelatase subunit ChlD/MoxR-like ATPase